MSTPEVQPDGSSLAQRVATARPPGARTDSGAPLAAATVLRLLCGASTRVMVSAKGNPLHLGRSVRHATHRQRRALQTRDGCCRFPGCTQTKRLIPHHVWWWSRGGPTDLDNLLLICPAHHRAVHEVGYTIATLGDGRFAFYRPDGARLPETGPPVDVGSASTPLHGIDAHAITWAGERLDVDMLVQALAANTINAAGRDLSAVPHDELPGALREAAQWPWSRLRRRPGRAAPLRAQSSTRSGSTRCGTVVPHVVHVRGHRVRREPAGRGRHQQRPQAVGVVDRRVEPLGVPLASRRAAASGRGCGRGRRWPWW